MTSNAQIMRERQILEYLTDNEGGASDIDRALDIPYPTARRILAKLHNEKKLELVNYKHGHGGYRYKTKNNDPMPWVTSFGQNYPAIQYLNEMADRAHLSGGRFTSDGISDATHHIALGLATVFMEAYRVYDTGKIDEKQLTLARESLIKSEKVFAEMAKICHQILSNPTFWDETLLLALTRSKDWNGQQVVRNYNTLTTKIQEAMETY